jgi:2Fe-2S ferredoxin
MGGDMADGFQFTTTAAARVQPASATITYVLRDGTRREVDVPHGYTVMEGARRYGIPGIEGDCGGACACATCHVYLEGDWTGRLPLSDELETGMLEFAFDVRPTSRLSCQIKVDQAVDGLVVRIPERQY